MKLPAKNKATQILEQYCQAYKKRDLKTILSLFTKDCNLWGTGVDEHRVGLTELAAQHERDWSQSEQGEIDIVSLYASPDDDHWVAAECRAKITIDGQTHALDHLRGTIIIQKEEGMWKISHMHASFPDFRNAEGSSFPL